VRQHFIHYLFTEKKFVKSLIHIEARVQINKQTQRADALIYTPEGKPFMLIECKAPHVKISRTTFLQISRYNIALQVPYLAITNGLTHFYFYIDYKSNKIDQLDALPTFKSLI